MNQQDKSRFLIIGTGRSGSSILSAILADAGANFDMPPLGGWDTRGGAYEHPRLLAAYRWHSRANKIAESLWPDMLGRKFCENRSKQELTKLFVKARFAKYGQAIWLLPAIVKLGYRPYLIVSYRSFDDYAASYHVRSGFSLLSMVSSYVDIYSTALLQLSIFGGCAIGYEELVNLDEIGWADAIGSLAGLSTPGILEARQQRIKPQVGNFWPKLYAGLVDTSVANVYSALCALKGKMIRSEYID